MCIRDSPYGVDYARIYILGSIFVLIVMGMNPFITTQGFAKISMMTTVIGQYLTVAQFDDETVQAIMEEALKYEGWTYRCV